MSKITLILAGLVALSAPALADEPTGLLPTAKRHVTLTSTVTDNGDLNPYAVAVVPQAMGKLAAGDVLVTNFNNISNLQGTGGSIISYSPTSKKTELFVQLPQNLPACPGGVGLTTALAVLKSGWVIVGSTPSKDGTTRTRGDGCLLVLDATGKLVVTWAGANINGPWGNMTWADNGTTATLFISMAGYDLPGPDVLDPATGRPVEIAKATVVRFDLQIPDGKQPVIARETVVADKISQRADRDDFLYGPTGLALGADDTLYIADTLSNRIIAVDHASTRTGPIDQPRVITQGQLLQHPLAMALTPLGHLLVANGKNGQVVEVDPLAGKQLYAQWLDANQAQSPPGNGDLFGLAMRPDGKGFYYVTDDMNFLMEARP